MALEINDIQISSTATKQGKLIIKRHVDTVDPTVNDDSSAGYDMGDRWMNSTSDDEFVLCDASVGAAVWKKTTEAGGGDQGDQAAAQAHRTTTLVPTGTLTALSFDTTDFENDDTIIDHDDTNRSRFYLHESGAHTFHISIVVENSSPQSKTLELRLYKNGVAVPGLQLDFEVAKNARNAVTRFSVLDNAVAGDYYEIWTAETGGGNDLTIQAGTRFAVIRMTGEKGATGATGAAGADGDITWEGPWVSQNYVTNQAVEYQGSSYVCILNTTASQVPTDNTYWDLLASKGDAGSSGNNKWVTIMKDNGSDLTETSPTYMKLARLIYDGANETLAGAKVHLYLTGGATSVECRIYDATNALEIASVTTSSTSATNIVTFGTLSNLPAGLALLNFEFKVTGVGEANTSGIALEF